MVATHVLAKVEPSRLQKAVEGLVAGAYTIVPTSQTEAEIYRFVANGDGKEYGVVLTEAKAFRSFTQTQGGVSMAVKVKQHKGKWWVFIDHKGKRKAKCIGDSKRAAQQVAEKIQAKISLGQFEIMEEKQRRPFDTYFQNWLETYAKAHCQERTHWLYGNAFDRYLLPAFGHKDITAITREEVKTLAYGLLATDKARKTVELILAPLSEMFNHAIEDGHLTANPVLRILRRHHAPEATAHRKADALTREELGLLLRTCQEHFPSFYPFFSLLARTGLRFGEAIGLQWDDIDFHGGFIEGRRTVMLGRVSTPKSGKTRRVDMSRQLAETLKALLLERKKETLRKGRGDVPPWVFLTTTDTPLYHTHVRHRVWCPLLRKTGLRHIRVHDLRHTFASLLIQQGESLAYVKEQMGHHSIKMTVDTYGHLMPGGNRAAVDRLDGLENTTLRNPDATSVLNGVSEAAVNTGKK